MKFAAFLVLLVIGKSQAFQCEKIIPTLESMVEEVTGAFSVSYTKTFIFPDFLDC